MPGSSTQNLSPLEEPLLVAIQLHHVSAAVYMLYVELLPAFAYMQSDISLGRNVYLHQQPSGFAMYTRPIMTFFYFKESSLTCITQLSTPITD